MKKTAKPFWKVPEHQAPAIFKNFMETPPLMRRFHVPLFSDTEVNADFCPKCDSENIQDQDAPADGVLQVSCQDCGHEWTELQSIFDVDDSEVDGQD